MSFTIPPIVFKIWRYLIKNPITGFFTILFWFLKSPLRIGGLIITICFLIGVYDSVSVGSLEPLARYVGGMTLNTGGTISNNLSKLGLGNISLWDILICWFNIISALYMFFLLWIGLAKAFRKTQGDQIADLGTGIWVLIFITLLTNIYVLQMDGHYPEYLGFGGFIDLGHYILDHKGYIERLINQTSYGNGIGNISQTYTINKSISSNITIT
ncbi:MAG: hypothetical protein DRP06_01670 [Candidatus Aenigmatarchaeota archaeon]|nr:MAG: hypothetical protein DRP06_01670 [Candidatus Aenigmarchaeota archaeon]